MKILIKKAIKNLFSPSLDPLIEITISESNLLKNLEEFRKIKPENHLAPVLKSNAYGHGLIEVASVLKNRVGFFVIDSYFEAQVLRSNRITTPLLVIGFVRPETMKKTRLRNISFTISSLDILKSIDFPTRIHLKIDTGMNRQGIPYQDLDIALDYLRKNKKINLDGVCSHFSDSDGPDSTFTKKQISLWNSLVKKIKKEFPNVKYFHLSNTHGHQFAKEIDDNTSRPGIGLYGLTHIPGLNLSPVLEMNTVITNIKKIKKGDSVGYNNTYTAQRDMTLATIPVGYYEGLDRSLSNKGFVKINDKYSQIVGRVSMNITTICVDNISPLKIGDMVNVISSNPADMNSIQKMTEISEMITHELVVKIPTHLKRSLLKNDES